MSQEDLAAITGVAQATVSRWETGGFAPTLTQMKAIRTEAIRRGIQWDDSLFFEDTQNANSNSNKRAA